MSEYAVANLAPQTFADALKFCDLLAKTEFVPKQFKGKSADILAAIQFGAELGVGPMQALQNIMVVNGRPSIFGDLALALVLNSGKLDYFAEEDNGTTATCKVKRKGDKEIHVVCFSMDDARRAKLPERNPVWNEYPQRMRMFRARGFALRDKFPDVLKGLITREEAQDYPASVETTAKPADDTPLKVVLDAPQAPSTASLEDDPPTTAPDEATATSEQRKALWKAILKTMAKPLAQDWIQLELNKWGFGAASELTVKGLREIYEDLLEYQQSGQTQSPSPEEPRFATEDGQEPDITW